MLRVLHDPQPCLHIGCTKLKTLNPQVPALPRVVVFITNRRVPIPDVLPTERFLIAPLALSGFYHVVARYGCAAVCEKLVLLGLLSRSKNCCRGVGILFCYCQNAVIFLLKLFHC